jgi:uncharacterized metal-binding protein YceD (DUF177 family)
MDPLRKYEVAFVGLKQGLNQFEFEVDDRFFELFTDSLIRSAQIHVALDFEKHASFFMLRFHISGIADLPCDRCGVQLGYPLEHDCSIVVKFDEHREGDLDDSQTDVMYINRNDSHINVAQLIYELVSLSLPLNHINCDNLRGAKPCDQNVLNQLKQIPVREIGDDHRWDDLRKIKFN